MNLPKTWKEDRLLLLAGLLICGFVGATFFHSILLAVLELVCLLGVGVWLRSVQQIRKRELLAYLKKRDADLQRATKATIVNAALPMVIFQMETEEIIWSNQRFLDISGTAEHIFDTKLSEAIPNFNYRWLLDGEPRAPLPVTVQGQQYLVYGNLIDGDLATCYWVEMTHYLAVEDAFEKSRPVVAVISIDNYEDLMRGIEENERSLLLSDLHQHIRRWVEPTGGILCHYDRDQYLLLVEAEAFAELRRQRFSLLETVHSVRGSNEITASLSIGIAKGLESLRALFQHAMASMEMALSRGGDQVVLRDETQYHFFGGKAKEIERRTKIRSRVVANAFMELLGGASRVLIMGHRAPDLDVTGAAAALVAIARSRALPAYVLKEAFPAPAEEMYQHLATLSEYADVFVTEEEALALVDDRTLLVVVDTNRPEQVQAPALLDEIKRVVVIDHHRRATTYIESAILSFEDSYASSASELCTELLQHLVESTSLTRTEAEAILAGIVLDTKHFTLRTGARTFEAASYLRRAGADTVVLRRFFQTDLAETMARYDLERRAVRYRDGLAIAVTEQLTDRITAAKAADELLNIAEIETSFVLFPADSEHLMISARSRGDINVQMIVESLGGGGNAASAGVQLQGLSLEEALEKLHTAINQYFSE